MAASDWVDLGSENIGFVATLDRASGISLFAKDPDSAKVWLPHASGMKSKGGKLGNKHAVGIWLVNISCKVYIM